jgi:hypothetical protein
MSIDFRVAVNGNEERESTANSPSLLTSLSAKVYPGFTSSPVESVPGLP